MKHRVSNAICKHVASHISWSWGQRQTWEGQLFTLLRISYNNSCKLGVFRFLWGERGEQQIGGSCPRLLEKTAARVHLEETKVR